MWANSDSINIDPIELLKLPNKINSENYIKNDNIQNLQIKMMLLPIFLSASLLIFTECQFVYVVNRKFDGDIEKRQSIPNEWKPQRFGKRSPMLSEGSE